jgi:putative glutamine amidotransferase
MSDIVIATPPFTGSFEQAFEQKIPSLSKDISKIYESKLVIFSGGEDINPEIYGQENRHSSFNPDRDKKELEVLDLALRLNKKILGVCRGHQLINAYLGGILAQDLWQELKTWHGGGHELIFTTQDSIIKKMFKNGVNSMHHQGVIKTGGGLTSTSEFGGVIESCESENIITVQFHPEFMWFRAEKFFNFLKDWKE